MVVVQVPEGSLEAEMYRVVADPHRVTNGVVPFVLSCSEIDPSGPHYLSVVLNKEAKIPRLRLNIPHRLVVMTAEAEQKIAGIGFFQQTP